MAGLARGVEVAATPWFVPIARAVPALVLGAVVTFSADHSAPLGLVTLGAFGTLTGIVLVGSALRLGERGIVRSVTLAQGLVSAAIGVVSLSLPAGGLPFLVFLVTTFGAITGLLELYLGIRSRGRAGMSRDWTFIGALTAALAVVALLIPPDFSQTFTGPDGVERALTASIVLVGILGAYWVIVGVYLVIGGLSLKWAADEERGVERPTSAVKSEA